MRECEIRDSTKCNAKCDIWSVPLSRSRFSQPQQHGVIPTESRGAKEAVTQWVICRKAKAT